MHLCKARKKGGVQCNGRPGEGNQYCAFHRKRYAANIKTGEFAKPEILGVPKEYLATYQEFLNSPKPTDLRSELAYLRVLHLEVRKLLEVSATLETVERDVIQGVLEKCFFKTPECEERFTKHLKDSVEGPLAQYIGFLPQIAPDALKELTITLDTISRVAERAHKMANGIEVKVQINQTHLIGFMRDVVLPCVPEPERQAEIVRRAKTFTHGLSSGSAPVVLNAELQEVSK